MTKLILRFLILAPAIGCLVFLAVLGLSKPSHSQLSISFAAELAHGGPVLFVIAYVIAGIPAALCGLIYWFILKKVSSVNFKWPVRMLVGGVVGTLSAIVFSRLHFSVLPFIKDPTVIVWGVLGALGGAGAALTVGHRLYYRVFPDREQQHAT